MDERFLRATVSVRGVCCTPGDAVLALRRRSDGEWELPGGRIHPTEGVVACLRRELREETGLDVDVHRPVHAVTWRNDGDEGRLAVFYDCSAPRSEVVLSEEHDRHVWLPIDADHERLGPPQRRAVERAWGVNERRRDGADVPTAGHGDGRWTPGDGD